MSLEIKRLTPIENAPGRILILDDNEDIIMVLTEISQDEGAEVDCALNVNDAVSLLEERKYGLIVTDICLPGENGLTFARKVREHEVNKDCPLLIISAFFSQQDLEKAEKAFPNSMVLKKPLDIKDFCSVLSYLMPNLSAKEQKKKKKSADKLPQGFTLYIDNKNLELSLEAVEEDKELIKDYAGLNELIKKNELAAGKIDKTAVQLAFKRLEEKNIKAGDTIIIARGKKPVTGKDGSIDFKIDVSGKCHLDIDKPEQDENIDFKEIVSVTVVQKGDLLAEVIPPEKGKNGVDLKGNSIEAKKGRPRNLQAGSGVTAQDDPPRYYADTSGIPFYSGSTLSINPVYEINGDVDYSTGNISFDGHVKIKGNVQDGFNVECESAEIAGTIGASIIKCSKDLIVNSGVNAKHEGEISVRGDAYFKYLNQADIKAFGNIEVLKEINNSTVWSQGKVSAGQIMGGECIALLGIEVNQAGSELGVPTVFFPGTNFEVKEIESKIETIEKELDNLLKPFKNFLGDRTEFQKLPEEEQKEARENLSKITELCNTHKSLMSDRDMLRTGIQAAPEVKIVKQLHSDVRVQTEKCAKLFRKPLTGPFTLVEDIASGSIQPKS
ncbi:MAG: FapA family protein [Planctomycetota bacterium]|jgi:uncharacterized protein (DUF342 family)/CheY-like chemotaxis protein